MKSQKWLPYLLVLPTLLYLGIFFAYPMLSALQLAVTAETRYLNLLTEPDVSAERVPGAIAMQTVMEISDRVRGEELLPNGRTRPIYWFEVTGPTVDNETVSGWVNQQNIFVESRTESTQGRINGGEPVMTWTLQHIQTMFSDFRFQSAITNTLLLIIIVLPIQFVLAIIMALILQAQPRFNNTFLYIYAIPLGISDLAAGLVWYSLFTQRGFINSLLVQLGLMDTPFIFISSGREGWILLAIVLAEVWRATSIVMVIVVSGLQAVSREYTEAGEVFGATLWQRIRYIILPLLRPSLQVALILRTILAFQVFAVIIAISGGDIFTVLSNETYRWYDRGDGGYNNPNVAAAYAGLIMVISLAISFFYLRAVRTQDEVAKS
jgi:multiple sugar transport system permease protein